jgi:hypothetical protein
MAIMDIQALHKESDKDLFEQWPLPREWKDHRWIPIRWPKSTGSQDVEEEVGLEAQEDSFADYAAVNPIYSKMTPHWSKARD